METPLVKEAGAKAEAEEAIKVMSETIAIFMVVRLALQLTARKKVMKIYMLPLLNVEHSLVSASVRSVCTVSTLLLI